MNDKNYNNLKLISYILLAVGIITVPADFPYHYFVAVAFTLAFAIGSAIANYLTSPDTILGGAESVAQAIVKAVSDIKQAPAEAKVVEPIDANKVALEVSAMVDQAVAEYKQKLISKAVNPTA